MLDWVVLLAVAAFLGTLAPVHSAALAAAAVLLTLLVVQRCRTGVLAACAVAMIGSAARAEWRVCQFRDEVLQIHTHFSNPQRCELVASVASQPTRRSGTVGFVVDLQHADCEGGKLAPGTRLRLYGGPEDLARGEQVVITADVSVVQLFRNHDLPDPHWTTAYARVALSGGVLHLERVRPAFSVAAWTDRARARVRQRIEATYAPGAGALAKALVLGENDLSPEEDGAFKLSGLSHLLAVSGTHLVIAVGSLVGALRWLLGRCATFAARWDVGRLAAALGIPIALQYADFAGGSGSAWRAAWMLASTYVFRVLGRSTSPLRDLAFAVLIGVLVNPLVGFDLSFELSLAATLGLLHFGRQWVPLVRAVPHPGARAFVSNVVTSCAAIVPCAGVLALISSRLSLVGILANALAAPFGEVIALPVCLAHAVSWWWPAAERGLAVIGSGALLVVRRIALLSAGASWLSIPLPAPTAWHYLCLAGLFGCWMALGPSRRRRLGIALSVVGLLLAEFLAWHRGHPTGHLRVTVLDVGQGDCALIDLPDGKLMLVDAGGFVGSPVDPGERVVLPVLRARRRSALDVVVLSHPHPDHFTGLLPVVKALPVGEFWDTGQGEREGAGPLYARLLAAVRARGGRVRRPDSLCGVHAFGGAEVGVLAPCPSFVPGRDANDNSLVFRVSARGTSALFVGDAEEQEERELVETHGTRLRADLLKVGHHGSRTSSSTEFLHAVGANVATVSCGLRNRFGHPHQEALARLRSAVPEVVRIDLRGSFEWTSASR